MNEEVWIQLDEEPRLHAPLRTIVGPGPQAYTFFFREAMDRSSVEAAIRLHAREQASKEEFVEPLFSFHWVHDRQLRLLVTLPAIPSTIYETKQYVLNAAGAKTVNGAEIGDSASFMAMVFAPDQLWRMSLDGKVREKLTDFGVMYGMDFLDPEQRYLLLSRSKEYCECDARYVPLYAVYDRVTQESVRYPVALSVNYRGEGDFVADRRGFFYARPAQGQGMEVPSSPFAVPVKVEGYVHGASFSHDHRRLLMAVGAAEQKENLDLLIYDLDRGLERRLPGAIKGTIPASEMDGVIMPVRFDDDGRQATFIMRANEEDLVEIRQRYVWETGTVMSWNPPVPADSWAGYLQSDDGAYQMYWNAGLFHGTNQILDSSMQGVWVPRSHLFAYTTWEERQEGAPGTEALRLFDAERQQETVIAHGVPSRLQVIGGSRDGKWLYIVTDQDIGR